MDAALGMQWIAIMLIFLISSIWSQENAHFGGILIALMSGFFWYIGWLSYSYLPTVIPCVIFLAIFSFMRTQLRVKYGTYGTAGGLLPQVLLFLVMVNVAIVFVNGIGIFSTSYVPNPTGATDQYTLSEVNETLGQFSSSGTGWTDQVAQALALGAMAWNMFVSMILGVFTQIPWLADKFHVPTLVMAPIVAGLWFLTIVEIFMVFKGGRSMEP